MNDTNVFARLKAQRKKAKVITAYEFSQAKIAEAANMDALLVGDSLSNVVLGRDRTMDVGMQEMLLFTKAVALGTKKSHLMTDLPYASDTDPEKTVENAKLLIAAGADSVKIEGVKYEQIKALISEGIQVVGHLGLTPQTAKNFKQVGQTIVEAEAMQIAALELEKLGCIAIVLEHIPSDLAEKITQSLTISTIGIGAGKKCDGQVLVFHDALGLFEGDVPKIAKKFTSIFEVAVKGLNEYTQWVEEED